MENHHNPLYPISHDIIGYKEPWGRYKKILSLVLHPMKISQKEKTIAQLPTPHTPKKLVGMVRCHFQPSDNGRLGLLLLLRPIAAVKVEGGADPRGPTFWNRSGEVLPWKLTFNGSPKILVPQTIGISHLQHLITTYLR